MNRAVLPLFYPLLFVLGGLGFLTFIFKVQDPEKNTVKLNEIREWVQKELKLEKELIAVRKIYTYESERGLKVSAYLTAPCSSLCGQRSECAQICQEKMMTHEGPLFRSSILIEANQVKKKLFLGRTLIDSVGPLELVKWSKKENRLAFIQKSGTPCCSYLLVFQSQETESGERILKRDLQFQLGPYGKSDIQFQDYNQDDEMEYIVPEPHFAQLTPTPFKIPMVYQFKEGKIQPRPELMNLIIPTRDQYRAWLLEKGKKLTSLKELLAHFIIFCLKGSCQTADELMHLAYPQNETYLEYWSQLKQYALQFLNETSP